MAHRPEPRTTNDESQRREGPLEKHAGARRIAGGTARLVDTRAAALPAACVRTSSALLMLRDRGAWLELQTRSSAATRVLRGRRAVLALLQRGAEHVRFDPPLPALLADALAATPTLLSAELAFNNTSCALPNFPDEHQPDAALLRAIALELNARLVHACPDIDPAAVPARPVAPLSKPARGWRSSSRPARPR